MEIDPKTGSPILTNEIKPLPPHVTDTKSDKNEPHPLQLKLDELKEQHNNLSETYSLVETENQSLKSNVTKLQNEVITLNNRKPHLSLQKKHLIEVALTRTSMDSQQRARVMEELELIINS